MKHILAELHCHSNCSDGKPSVKQMMEKASNDLGAIAITDHNTSKGSNLALKLEKNYDVIVIPGVEILCRKNGEKAGEILAFGTNHAFSGNVLEVVDKIHSAGGIAVAAHPFGGMGSPAFSTKELLKAVDAIEVYNASAFPWKNKKSFQLAKKLKKPMTAGSDAHLLNEIGTAACRIPANNLSSILKAIKHGKVILPRKRTNTFSVLKMKTIRKLMK